MFSRPMNGNDVPAVGLIVRVREKICGRCNFVMVARSLLYEASLEHSALNERPEGVLVSRPYRDTLHTPKTQHIQERGGL